MKHNQAHALLDLFGHKGQQRGGIRACLHAIPTRERETRNEKREEKDVKAAHDAGSQRAVGLRRI